MITVSLVLTQDGCFVSVSAKGHALQGSPGTDVVCAAVSVLIRTTLAVLDHGGRVLQVETAGRGTLDIKVTACKESDLPLLRYAGLFLHRGIAGVAAEYPASVEMREQRVTNSSIKVLEE
ncbi:MAG TPA: ribosomal-processing cysteine protease Prp [Treponema sp.]|nr:ribosomal-processing cysteine protease Prp [Treponema sp.]